MNTFKGDPRFLILNCPSEYFDYIPMGTFGLSDYLEGKGIETKILNLSLYERSSAWQVLDRHMERFGPTHVGVVFHWQETVEGFLDVTAHIKSRHPDLPVISGGFAAGYFGTNLLERCASVDYLVKGDPERPLVLLMKGKRVSAIPNLIYREGKRVVANETSYFMDEETLSRISFAGITCLYDYKRYLSATEKRLGFPIFIGRGCLHSCGFCGGASRAYRTHSGRKSPVTRPVESVIADLKRLKGVAGKIYMCYENDREYVKALFREVGRTRGIAKRFVLNYGTWDLFDRELLELYREAFITGEDHRPLLELSPEVYDDKARKRVKVRATYSMDGLKDNLSLINEYLHRGANVSVFFSRYHETATTYKEIREEIKGISRFAHEVRMQGFPNVGVHYDHLSTDVGSFYWERHVKNAGDLDTLVSSFRRIQSHALTSFPFNNLCLYIPGSLSEDEVFRIEMLSFILKRIYTHYSELFHILYRCLGEGFTSLIEEEAGEMAAHKVGNPFSSSDDCTLLGSIRKKILKRKGLLSRVPFAEDLIGFFMNKALFHGRPGALISGYQTERPVLNNDLIVVCLHDYLDLDGFMKRMEREGPKKLSAEKTVFLFLNDEIMSMTYETYRRTIHLFAQGVSLPEYYRRMEMSGIFSQEYHDGLVRKLFQSGILY
jgi:hypothetical protein